uniref:Secreted protein PK-2 n=1 Tax=Ornithodoros moubata TaxID=6938 RepID=Q6QTE8_ORNMO|nr:secreted protein PK-2 [Ornithodoros moubata]
MNFQVIILAILFAVSAYGATVPTAPQTLKQAQDDVETVDLEGAVSKVISLLGRQLTVISETKSGDVTKEKKQQLEKELDDINMELQAAVEGQEEDLGATLETVSDILLALDENSDGESEYSKWKKLKQKLTSKKAKKIYKTAAKIAVKVAIKSMIG